MCEHLLCLYSMTSDKTALVDNTFPVYINDSGEMDVVLFGLQDEKADQFRCVHELLDQPITKLNLISPEALPGLRNTEVKYVDWDYHINLEQFDLDLRGKVYKNIRYRVNQTKTLGYQIKYSRKLTPSHLRLIARHAIRHPLDVWDFEELLSLERFFTEYPHGFMIEAYHRDNLIGFDVVDFFQDHKVMVVPLGIYSDAPALADFFMYQNILYAKQKGYEWLDVGLACREPGLQAFKTKWLAQPRFKLVVQTITK